MTIIEDIQKAITITDTKIRKAKQVLEFPTYLLGVKEGLEWCLRLIKEAKDDRHRV